MKKVIAEAIFGLLFLVEGFLVGYIYLLRMGEGASPLLLIFSVPVVIIGVFLLMNAGKANNISKLVDEQVQPKAADSSVLIDATNQKSMLQRNNDIMNEWSKTYETREKLKMLKIAASAAEQGKK